ncbi:sigma-70 family RNA polymerase sigma factor [Nocardioides sp. TF02-7]|uniref:sigma-70 family RNA polymerase sigma factor n=1 Tax=Nocardioides sp. TF02-7 TaxID=2917724 RepID=UPI001F05E821|nr:sigma-70 family RNA polymerase sigma factor [Nocardioides sp. TF02-7]UMG93611.1 sigma-70 family RNA polymerase sigma factor [Nocardioides sp. TF02-7]
MSEGTSAENRPADDVLLARARAGDTGAFEELYRAHVEGARHLARILVGTEHADELTAESFARVLAQLRAGNGPTSNFRSYLHVTIRNGYRDGLRATREAPASDQPWLFDDAEPAAEEMVDGFDETVAVDALSSLPESWQRVLWHVEVEGRKPGEVATMLDMRPGAVSSLAHRAREGLKRAYLDLQVGPGPAAQQCRWTHARMSQYARGDLGDKARSRFEAHVSGCVTCSTAFATVEEVNRKLAAYVLPVVLVAVAPGSGKAFLWLWGTGGLAAAGGGSAGGTSGGTVSGGPLRSLGNPGPAVAASVAVVAAVAATVWGLTAASGDQRERVRSTAEEPSPVMPTVPSTTPPRVDPGQRPDPGNRPDPRERDEREERPPEAPVVTTDGPVDPVLPTTPPADEPTDPATPSDDTPDDPDPVPVVVRPVAPAVQPITVCETYGSVRLPSTTGVTYRLEGGREGPWSVVAAAQPGYVLAEGAQTRWSGDLGPWFACDVTLGRTSVSQVTPGSGEWRITTGVDVPAGGPRAIELLLDLTDTPTGLVQAGGDGWTCTRVALEMMSCTFDYAGTAPGPVSIVASGLPWIAGTMTLLVDGVEVDSRSFLRLFRTPSEERGERASSPAAAPAPPAPEEPVVEEPVVEEPVVEEPVVEEPAVEEPAVEEPAVEEPVVEEPVTEDPAADEPAADEPVTQEPEADEPVTDDALVG